MRFLARRLLNYIVLLALASFLTFGLASFAFRPLESLQQRNPRPPQAVIDAKRAELDLDKPIPVRYLHWASGAVHGDFGTTIGGQPVSDELWRRIGMPGRPEHQRLPDAARWGQLVPGARLEKGAPLFPRRDVE